MVGTPVGDIVARWSGDSPVYAEMARVLDASARRNSPRWTVDVHQSRAAPLTRYEAFVEKVRSWRAALLCRDPGDLVALLDVDTIVTGPLDDVANVAFDVAVTTRPLGRHKINSGVLFARVGPVASAFFDAWIERTEALSRCPDSYRFSDQDALAEIVGCVGAEVARLPCRVWNCEQTSWARFDPARTRIVHIKSDARKRIFHGGPRCTSPGGERVVALWRQYQEAAG